MRKAMTLCALIALFAVSCFEAGGLTKGPPSLRLGDNAVAGWVEDSGSFVAFDTNSLFQLINGGAPLYIEQGLIDGIFQKLHFDTLFNLTVYAEDFGSAKNSRTMLDTIKAKLTPDLAIPGFADSTAIASGNIGGCTVFSRFNNYYIELQFSGYADITKALGDAGSFLAVYRSMIVKTAFHAETCADRHCEAL